jgi:hypothetical protein
LQFPEPDLFGEKVAIEEAFGSASVPQVDMVTPGA